MNSLIIAGARQSVKEIYFLLHEGDPEMNVVFGASYQDQYGRSNHVAIIESTTWEEAMTPEEKSNWINFGNKPLTRNKIRDIIDQTEYLYYLD